MTPNAHIELTTNSPPVKNATAAKILNSTLARIGRVGCSESACWYLQINARQLSEASVGRKGKGRTGGLGGFRGGRWPLRGRNIRRRGCRTRAWSRSCSCALDRDERRGISSGSGERGGKGSGRVGYLVLLRCSRKEGSASRKRGNEPPAGSGGAPSRSGTDEDDARYCDVQRGLVQVNVSREYVHFEVEGEPLWEKRRRGGSSTSDAGGSSSRCCLACPETEVQAPLLLSFFSLLCASWLLKVVIGSPRCSTKAVGRLGQEISFTASQACKHIYRRRSYVGDAGFSV